LHLNHGPIDLVIEAVGSEDAVAEAYRRAVVRFDGLLEELVEELPALRSAEPGPLRGDVARAMARAVAPHRPGFVTPMAAVAGAVADAVCAAMVAGGGLSKAHVNNGGDIAFHLALGATMTAAIAGRAGMQDRVTIGHADPARGIATSGWRGRSWSLGIADAVTVLAGSAAEADAAATLVANAVDLPGHPAIERVPARQMQADTDLGELPVTTGVGPLAAAEVDRALDAGVARAEAMLARGLIAGAALFLAGEVRLVGLPRARISQPEPEAAIG
jgi:ApbE superfamily uncharacterized protein (UPF0280 family)